MAEGVYTNPANQIQVTATIHVIDPNTLSAFEHDRIAGVHGQDVPAFALDELFSPGDSSSNHFGSS
jgi:hypothetical protein